MRFTADDWRQAIFGLGDGATTTIGMIGLMWVSGNRAAILYGVLGGAISSTIGMGGNEYISDPDSNVHRALMMGAATFVGSMWPALPLVFGHDGVILPLCAALLLVLGAIITIVKARTVGYVRAALEVYVVFIAASVATVLVGLALPSS